MAKAKFYGKKYSSIVIAVAIIVLLCVVAVSPMVFERLGVVPGYPSQFYAYQYRRYKEDYKFGEVKTDNYLSVSTVQMPFWQGRCYATVERYQWFIWQWQTGETAVSVELGKDWSYGISATHGDVNLLRVGDRQWEYEKDYVTAVNPQIVNLTYVLEEETFDNGTIRTTYVQDVFKIYRMWTTVTLTTYGEEPIVRMEYGTIDAEMIKLAVANALAQINLHSHIKGWTDAMDNQQYPGVCLALSIDPMAVTSGEDWWGFLGAWVGGQGVVKSGTLGGSSAQLEYEHPHDVIAAYKTYGFPLNPHNPDNERAYKLFESYTDLASYSAEDLRGLKKDMLSTTVLLPIHILDMGVTYRAVDGDPADLQSFVAYDGPVSATIPIVFDILTTSESTWYEDYIRPESNPEPNCGNIKGKVTDESGNPIGGVQINVGNTNYSAVSASDGSYEILNVPAGEYVLHARKIGYADAEASVNVRIGYTTVRDITMTKLFSWMDLFTWLLWIGGIGLVVYIGYQIVQMKMLGGKAYARKRAAQAKMVSTVFPKVMLLIIVLIIVGLIVWIFSQIPSWTFAFITPLILVLAIVAGVALIVVVWRLGVIPKFLR